MDSLNHIKTETRKMLMKESLLHPRALPQDYIKLIFQSEFGPGHLISDTNYAYNRLVNEWEQVKDLLREDNRYIGGGYVRICLKGIDRNRLEKINTAFVTSANQKSGTETGFMRKIDVLLNMAEYGLLPVDSRQTRKAVQEYLAGGIRPTSHTREYHRHYKPAYRVVKADLLK